MLMIRLSRVGKKHHPLYRVVISEKRKDTVGDYLELLGQYDPHTNTANLKAERIQYWISKGAQTSGTVHNLLVHHKIITGEKIKVANIKRQKKKDDDKQESVGEKKEESKTAKPADNKQSGPPQENPDKEKSEEKKPESAAKPAETTNKVDKQEETEDKK